MTEVIPMLRMLHDKHERKCPKQKYRRKRWYIVARKRWGRVEGCCSLCGEPVERYFR